MENKEISLSCINKYNECTMDYLDMFYSKSIEWIEMPTEMYPNGRKGRYDDLKLFGEQILHLFPNRKLKTISSICENNVVVLEQEWSGVFSMDFHSNKKGDIVKQMVLSIFTIENGKIIKQIDYCSYASRQ